MRVLAWLWTFPNTLLGLGIGVLCGARPKWTGEAFEITGPGVARLLDSPIFRAGAVTLGHVVLAQSPEVLAPIRRHELRHVRQYEVLGPFFLPLYGLASLLALLRGQHFYRNNWFEEDAQRHE